MAGRPDDREGQLDSHPEPRRESSRLGIHPLVSAITKARGAGGAPGHSVTTGWGSDVLQARWYWRCVLSDGRILGRRKGRPCKSLL